MEGFKTIRLFFFLIFGILLVATPSCLMVDELSQEEELIHQEQKIVEKLEVLTPELVLNEIEDHFEEVRGEPDHLEYLDSFALAVDDLIDAVETNFSIGEYKEAVERTQDYWQSEKKAARDRCPSLGYAKGIKINLELAGSVGGVIVAGLQGAGGGGIKTIYDFVNLERQVYYYTFCSYGFNFGVGASAALKGSVGFSGISEILTGISYHGDKSGLNSFQGSSLSKSHSISGSVMVGFKLGLSVGIGSSQSAYGDFNGIENLLPCPYNMILIENGIIGYSFEVSASVGGGPGAEIILAYKNNNVGSNSHGVEGTYLKYDAAENFKRKFDNKRRRRLGGIKMAAEILFMGPFPGFISIPDAADVAASAFAFKYGSMDFTDCADQLPAIGTKKVEDVQSKSAISGGYIKDDGGAPITARGVCWSTTKNFMVYNKFTNDGIGEGDYTSIMTELEPNTRYYIKAYATNGVGTAFGEEQSFITENEMIVDPPTITHITPANGASGVDVNTTIEIDFSREISFTSTSKYPSLSGSIASIWDSNNNEVEYYAQIVSGNRIILTPNLPLNPGEAYSLRVHPGIVHDNLGSYAEGTTQDIHFSTLDDSGLTVDINDILPQKILDIIEEMDITIYGGNNPPNVEDTYFVTPNVLIKSNIPGDNIGEDYLDVTIKFYDQNNTNLSIKTKIDQGTKTSEGSGSFIVGEGNKFTIVGEDIWRKADNSIWAKAAYVISAEVVEGGLKDFHHTVVMVDDYGDPSGTLIEIGQLREFYDSNGFSEKVSGLKYSKKGIGIGKSMLER